eukprot:403357698
MEIQKLQNSQIQNQKNQQQPTQNNQGHHGKTLSSSNIGMYVQGNSDLQKGQSQQKNNTNSKNIDQMQRLKQNYMSNQQQNQQIRDTNISKSPQKSVGKAENKASVDLFQNLQVSMFKDREAFSVERRAANGNYVAFACGPLRRPRYINERIEQELVEFKQEIEERFEKSAVNKEFIFPLVANRFDCDEEINRKKKIQMDKFLEIQAKLQQRDRELSTEYSTEQRKHISMTVSPKTVATKNANMIVGSFHDSQKQNQSPIKVQSYEVKEQKLRQQSLIYLRDTKFSDAYQFQEQRHIKFVESNKKSNIRLEKQKHDRYFILNTESNNINIWDSINHQQKRQNFKQQYAIVNFLELSQDSRLNTKLKKAKIFQIHYGNQQCLLNVINPKHPVNFASFLSQPAQDSAQQQYKRQNSKRKSSRTQLQVAQSTNQQKVQQEPYNKSQDRNQGGIYKSLALNIEDGQSLLQSAINLQSSSRNQSELVKPHSQGTSGNNTASFINSLQMKSFANQIAQQQILSNKAHSSNNTGTKSASTTHSRTKTQTSQNLANYMAQQNNQALQNQNNLINPQILKTFDQRVFSPQANQSRQNNLIVKSPQSHTQQQQQFINQFQNVSKNQSLLQSSNQSQLRDSRKIQIVPPQDLKNFINLTKPLNTQNSSGNGMSTTPNKYTPIGLNSNVNAVLAQQYQNVKDFQATLDTYGNNQTQQQQSTSKRLSGVYMSNQSRNVNSFVIGQLNPQNNTAGQVNKTSQYQQQSNLISGSIKGSLQQQSSTQNNANYQKKKTINQPHQRMFSPPQDRIFNLNQRN